MELRYFLFCSLDISKCRRHEVPPSEQVLEVNENSRGVCSGGKFVVFGAGEAYDVRARGPNANSG